MRRALALLVAPALLLLAACGGEVEDDATPDAGKPPNTINAVQVNGKAGAKPSLQFDKPYTARTTESKVVDEGAGTKVKKGDAVVVDYVGVNARDGKEFDTSWAANRPPLLFSLEEGPGGVIPGFSSGLVGKQVGDRVLISIPPKDGYPKGNKKAGIKKGDSLLFVVDLLLKPGASAKGAAVEPEAGLPEVKLDDNGRPASIAVPKTDPPAKVRVQPLIKGDGAKVQADSTVAVHILGVNWRTGTVIESSWKQGQPYVLPVPSTFEGLKNGLVGQTDGSRVEVVVPPAQGFGQDIPGTDVKKDDTLVFVIDIVGVV